MKYDSFEDAYGDVLELSIAEERDGKQTVQFAAKIDNFAEVNEFVLRFTPFKVGFIIESLTRYKKQLEEKSSADSRTMLAKIFLRTGEVRTVIVHSTQKNNDVLVRAIQARAEEWYSRNELHKIHLEIFDWDKDEHVWLE